MLVAFGTAAPVLTSLAGRPASLQSSFYERISIPLGMATVLLMAVAPALRWSKQAGWSWLTALLPGLLGGLGTLAVLLVLGRVREPWHVVLLAPSGAALGINAWVTVRRFRRGWSYGAGYLGHVGIAIKVLGMILSNTLGRTERFRLAAGVPREVMGYRLTHLGEHVGERGRHLPRVRVRDRAREYEVGPELFKLPRGEGVMRKPYISRRPDLYRSPVEVESAAAVAGMGPGHGRAAPCPPEGGGGTAVLELSTKPFVDLAWIGALIALLGAAIAGVRRSQEVTAGRRLAAQPVAAAAP